MKQVRSVKDVSEVTSRQVSVWAHLVCISYFLKNGYPLDDYNIHKNDLSALNLILGPVLNEYRHQLIQFSQFYKGSAIITLILDRKVRHGEVK